MTNDHVLTKILSGYLILHLHESLNNVVAMHITKIPLLWALDIALLNFVILKLTHCTTYICDRVCENRSYLYIQLCTLSEPQLPTNNSKFVYTIYYPMLSLYCVKFVYL